MLMPFSEVPNANGREAITTQPPLITVVWSDFSVATRLTRQVDNLHLAIPMPSFNSAPTVKRLHNVHLNNVP